MAGRAARSQGRRRAVRPHDIVRLAVRTLHG